MTLPTNRTTANTPAEHVADHNTAHGLLNNLNGTYAPFSETATRTAADAVIGTALAAKQVTTLLDPSTLVAPVGSLLTVPTNLTGNDVVEPSILYDASAPFLGYEYVLCIASYYLTNTLYENPNLWVSHDGITWVYVVNGVPTPGYGGALTPIEPAGVQGDGNLSDPYLYRGPAGTYYILWNQFLTAVGSGGTGVSPLTWSIKGVSAPSLAGPWSTPVTILGTNQAVFRPSSPSIFWDGATWHMYAVDLANTSATAILHYTNPSANPLTGTWTKLTNPTMALPAGYTGQVWWHLNAYLWGTQHLLIIQDNAAGSSAGGNLWAVISADKGVTWTIPAAPMMASASLYRAALVPTDRGGFEFFYGKLAANWQLLRSFVSSTIPDAQIPASIARDAEVTAAVALRAPLTGATLWIPAAEMVLATGTPVLTRTGGGGRFEGWQFDAASTEQVNATFKVPVGWLTYQLDLYWSNSGGGAGNVVWASTISQRGLGDDLNSGDFSAHTNVYTAPALDILAVDASLTITVDAAKPLNHLRLSRAGANGSDTLANDAVAFGVMLRRIT